MEQMKYTIKNTLQLLILKNNQRGQKNTDKCINLLRKADNILIKHF
jgi:hypothetical protein